MDKNLKIPDDAIIVDSDEEINWINEKTGIDKDIIIKVFEMDSKFLEEKGIITYN